MSQYAVEIVLFSGFFCDILLLN